MFGLSSRGITGVDPELRALAQEMVGGIAVPTGRDGRDYVATISQNRRKANGGAKFDAKRSLTAVGRQKS